MIQSVELDEYQVIIGGDCIWTSFKAIQYEIPDWVIMILRQIFSGHFLDCFSGQSAEKESNLRFPFYSRPPMKELCNQFIQSKALITDFSITRKMI